MDLRTPRSTYIGLFQVWNSAEKKSKVNVVSHQILTENKLNDAPEDIIKCVNNSAAFICMKFSTKWEQANRTKSIFLKKNENWLENEISLEKKVMEYIISKNDDGPSGLQRGRPAKEFNKLCDKSKKRRVSDLVQNWNYDELSFAANLAEGSNTLPEKKSLSALQALGLYLDLGLSSRKYNNLRTTVNSLHEDTFPSYYGLKKIRNERLSTIEVSDNYAAVNLQALLDKTLQYIIESSSECSNLAGSLKLICKWGFDGSSGHSLYKQKFGNVDHSDESLFLIAIVPLQLVDLSTGNIKWENPIHPSSVLYCRSIKFIFTKETPTLISQEKAAMDQIIKDLVSFSVDQTLNISYELLFTMVDGSICNVVSETNSTQKCYICGCTPKDMNKKINFSCNEAHYQFGLSPLHCWIRSFECLLHISYRLDIKTWQVRGEESKRLFIERKTNIQKEFKEKLGLIVDMPKAGFGSSNDGNTARRFFGNPELSASITGININLIKNFSIILRLIASSQAINMNEFQELVKETIDLYLTHYEWYYMPVTVHKILIHGPDVISSFLLPIGQMSEEALECSHKTIRHIRQFNARKSSRSNTNKDIMTMLLLSSDPGLAKLRKIKTKKFKITADIARYLITDEEIEDTSESELSSD